MTFQFNAFYRIRADCCSNSLFTLHHLLMDAIRPLPHIMFDTECSRTTCMYPFLRFVSRVAVKPGVDSMTTFCSFTCSPIMCS